VGFASDWLKAHQLLGDDATTEAAENVRAWLGEAEAKVSETQHLSEHKRTPVTFRRLFLVRAMHGRSARILRRLFWLSIAWLLVVPTLATLAEVTEKHSSKNPSEVGPDLALLAVSAVIVLILRSSASAADRSHSPVAATAADRSNGPVAATAADPSNSPVAATPADRSHGPVVATAADPSNSPVATETHPDPV